MIKIKKKTEVKKEETKKEETKKDIERIEPKIYYFRDCHKTKLVFTYGDTEFYASNMYEIGNEIKKLKDDELKDTLFVNLTGTSSNYELVFYSHKLNKYLVIPSKSAIYNFIDIDWTDGSALDFNKNQWIELINIMLQFRRVYIYCIGGHGRTGTAFAIIGNILFNWAEPIRMTRELICEKCIETLPQIDYIQKITETNEDIFGSKELEIPVYKKYYRYWNDWDW